MLVECHKLESNTINFKCITMIQLKTNGGIFEVMTKIRVSDFCRRPWYNTINYQCIASTQFKTGSKKFKVVTKIRVSDYCQRKQAITRMQCVSGCGQSEHVAA